MESKNILFSLVATFAFALLASAFVSAGSFGTLNSVTVNDISFTNNAQSLSVSPGDTLEVRLVFTANVYQDNVEAFARIRSTGSFSDSTGNFDVLAGRTYTKTLHVKVPTNIDQAEDMILIVGVESQKGGDAGHAEIRLVAQRESYSVRILSVTNQDQVSAGDNLALNVVLKNDGFHVAEDNYVRASIAELGVSNTVYFGDLIPDDDHKDTLDSNKVESRERTIYLSIPSNAPAGVYTVQLEAFNADANGITQTKQIVVVSGNGDGRVLSSTTSKSFGVGEKATYSMTLVNTGNTVKIYDISVDAPKALTVNAEDTVVVVPAGSSKTVQFDVVSSREGDYDFTVNVKSDGQLVSQKSFSASVDGSAATSVNASVVLTVVLAIIFVVLVVVLIVLLTRKPNKTEEFGESYY